MVATIHPTVATEVIGVGISRRMVNRISIYDVQRVTEIRRHDGKSLCVCLLQEGGYQDAETSLAFPFLRTDNLTLFLNLCDETTRVHEFAESIRKRRLGKEQWDLN